MAALERETKEKDLEAINAFYKECNYSAGALITDTVFIAKDGKKIVGAVRLCEEEGVCVLRGMEIKKSHQRQGIGTMLLTEFVATLGNRNCYLISSPDLKKFYGQADFVFIPLTKAPKHLRNRVATYKKKDPKGKYRIMFKLGKKV